MPNEWVIEHTGINTTVKCSAQYCTPKIAHSETPLCQTPKGFSCEDMKPYQLDCGHWLKQEVFHRPVKCTWKKKLTHLSKQINSRYHNNRTAYYCTHRGFGKWNHVLRHVASRICHPSYTAPEWINIHVYVHVHTSNIVNYLNAYALLILPDIQKQFVANFLIVIWFNKRSVDNMLPAIHDSNYYLKWNT